MVHTTGVRICFSFLEATIFQEESKAPEYMGHRDGF